LNTRPVAPLFDGIDSGLREDRIARNDCDGAHLAIVEHLDIEHDRALNMVSLGFSRIFRFYPVNEPALRRLTCCRLSPA
jgi:hypothetical protein